MAKFLKRYNEETQQWELISAPDVSVIQQLESGSDITDTNVVVTNINYAGDSGETQNLDETLTVISDDISRLQRNVSWLAEHGGGGGGGGTGPSSPFGIVIVSPVLTDGAAYVSGKTFEIEFMITGGTDGEQCEYSYVYDSNPQTDYALVDVGTSVKIPIDNTGSSLKEHSMIIRAKNPYGTNISPQSFRIYESTLSLAFDVTKAGGDYNKETQVFNIRKDSQYANMPLLLTNGLMRSDTVIVAKCLDNTYTTDVFKNTTTEEQPIDISLWKIFPDKDAVGVGQYYVVTFQATATLGANTVVSNEVQLRIFIISPSEISIVLGVNGTSGEIVDAPLKSSLVYNFKVYTPAFIPPVESTYYCAKLENNTTGYNELVLGKYYDETLKVEGTTYSDNDSAAIGRTISSQWFLNSENYHVGDTLHLYVRIWSLDGTKTATVNAEIHVDDESNEVFPRQCELRSITDPYDTKLFSWNNSNAQSTTPTKWTSTNDKYGFMDPSLALAEGHTVIADINLYGNNDASGIHTEGATSYLRLQNRAYAIADVSRYAREVAMMTAEDPNLYGFTISFTIQVDNHNDTQHTLLLWGRNNASDGTLANGIRIDSDKAQWVVNERKNGTVKERSLSCHISSGTKHTIDFSYVRNTSTSATARIYVNGILNAAVDLEIMSPQTDYIFPATIYFGANYRNGNLERFSDLNIYEFSVYTKSLNDMQIAINGKNARFVDIDDYTAWKEKNFISANELDPSIPESVFFNNGRYITDFDTQQINNIAARSKIPTLYLNFPESSNFTSAYFYAKQTSSAQTFDATATYYDPDSRRDASFKVKVSLQGTSTLGYRIKNLEMYMDEYFSKDGETHVKLFQPKKEWLPESQFTLKADVVDSAHANNAILGEWINNSGAFKPNPAMQNYDANRPQDWDDAYSAATTDAEKEAHTYHDDVEIATIKHTLEGFPFLIFIKFSEKSSYTFLGIYSFNLGRYSYYNMGMKFLKGYSRREGVTKVACPKVINYYEEMPSLGNIYAKDVFSFEMGNNGNLKVKFYPVWSQYDRTVIQSYGSFRYMGSPEAESTAWANLCALFEAVAKFRITSYDGTLYPAYDGIEYYTIDSAGVYQTTGDEIAQTNDNNTQITSRLNVENAAAYFIVANAFGMTDSLGKNLTIRTWDGGETWWFCFYDMDTALGLANDGSEDNPVTVAIDRVVMRTDSATSASILETIYHDSDSKYAAVLSKIWGVLRDDRFLYLQTGRTFERYEYIWNTLRSSTGKLATSENFTNIMAARVDACGEMIYDYDYNTKYIQDTVSQEGEAAAAITFLHGTRVEYVKDWLRKHFYFLDGMFDAERLGTGVTFTYTDSPYNAVVTTFVANYSSSIPVLPFTVQVSTPAFIGLTVGSDRYKKYYIDTENVDTTIYFVNGTSSNSQLSVKGSSVLCKFNGLQGGFQAISDSNGPGVTKALSVFDASSSNALNNDPFHNKMFGVNGESSLESVNLSGTRGTTTLSKYEVDLSNCQKLIEVDISSSDVTALVLPNTSLQRLNVANSNIVNFALSNQNIISSIDFNGCNRLSTIEIDKCTALERVYIGDKANLRTVKITNCPNVTEVILENNVGLETVNIMALPSLRRLIVRSELGMGAVGVSVYNCPNMDQLTLNNIYSAQTVSIDTTSASAVKYLSLDNFFYFSGFSFNGNPVEVYGEDDDFVVDLTPFTSLNGANFSAIGVLGMHYLRVSNDSENPFALGRSAIQGSRSVITRVFGHFTISDSELFSYCTNFFIREPVEKIDGVTPFDDEYYEWDNGTSENPYVTNITIQTANLSDAFRATNCSLSDAYYVFKRCQAAESPYETETVERMFRDCQNLTTTMTDRLNPDIFSGLTNLSNIDELFNGANVGGFIYSSLLDPIKDNIESFNTVFGTNEQNSNKYYTKDDECFFPEGNNIKTIIGFNPLPYNDDYQTPYPVYDTEMLKTLTKVELIDNSFNDCHIDFTNGEQDVNCDLLKKTVSLKKIRRSFLRIKGWGSLRNIFGGESSNPNEFPQELETITNSFSFVEDVNCDHNDISSECPFVSDPGHKGVLMPIGNSFLNKIKGTIKTIGGREDSYYNERCFYSEDNNGRPGNGLRKYIDLPDCDGEDFCYHIFDGCTKLEEIPYFFEGVDFSINGEPSTISLLFDGNGTSMFSGLTKLWNVNGLFANMKNVNFELTSGYAFEDCAITSAAYIFREDSGQTAAKRIGMIPYKLFYQGDVENTVTGNDYGISEDTADNLGILADFIHYVEDLSGNPADYQYVGTDTPDKFKVNFTYTTPKCLITNLSHAFENSNSTGLTQFSGLNLPFKEWIADNENYNPIMFYMAESGSSYVYTYNTAYNPYKKKWNKYAFDGTEDFRLMVLSSTEYQKLLNRDPDFIDEYGNPILNSDISEGFGDYDDTFTVSSLSDKDTGIEKYSDTDPIYRAGTGLFSIQNYFCPQDIFRYCINNRSVNVDYTFENGCPSIQYDANNWSCGLKGRIPPYIFEPVTNITAISRIFYNCKALLPHRWATYSDDAVSATGVTYPPTLLSGLTYLSTFSSVFQNDTVWGRTIIPIEMFSTNIQLIDISSLWAESRWIEKDINQFPIGLFANNSKLQNLSALFMLGGPAVMNSNLFSKASNPSIKNTTSFLYRGSNLLTSSRVPEFWTWGTIGQFANTFYGIPQAIISAQNIPTEWYIER